MFNVVQGRLHPTVVAHIRQHADLEIQLLIKGGLVFNAVAIDKPTLGSHRIAILPQQPLVEFHLAFVANLPIGIQCHVIGF